VQAMHAKAAAGQRQLLTYAADLESKHGGTCPSSAPSRSLQVGTTPALTLPPRGHDLP